MAVYVLFSSYAVDRSAEWSKLFDTERESPAIDLQQGNIMRRLVLCSSHTLSSIFLIMILRQRMGHHSTINLI